jgi:protein tyrosine/serine phosphatase
MALFQMVVYALWVGLGQGPRALAAEVTETAARPAAWAQPVALPGVPNLHQVDDALYRSAQPDAEGMRHLKAMGLRSVINLRSFHSDRDELGDTGLRSEQITMKAWHPEEKELVRFLRLVTTPDLQPVLVHCQHGADRTGLLCAVYRVVIGGWSRQEALREMRTGGFGYHEVWVNLPDYIATLDVDGLRRQAGLPPAADSVPAQAQP